MTRDEREELARLERREASKRLRLAARVIDPKAQERLAQAAQRAQMNAVAWGPR